MFSIICIFLSSCVLYSIFKPPKAISRKEIIVVEEFYNQMNRFHSIEAKPNV
jgi:hypothetical protein